MKQLTNEEFEEFLKCRSDFKYFAEKYLQIVHPKKGLVPFKLYKFQERVIKEYEEFAYCILKKFRQAGATTLTSMWLLWKCLFFTDQRIMIMSKTDREARGVGKTVANAKRMLPGFLQPEMGNDNDHEKEFADTGSVMWFFTPSAARSRSLTYLVIDEAAFIPGMEDHWAGMYPTLATGGHCIVISTVNGVGNWYEEQYTRAKDKRNQFHIVNIDWREHPEYNNPVWEKRTRANLGARKFAQEIEGSFLSSGETFIPSDVIIDYENRCYEPMKKMLAEWDTLPEELFDAEELPNVSYEPGAMHVWEFPKPGREYIVAADVACGVGGDNCAFVVMDITSLSQVSEFYSSVIPPYKFAQILAQTGSLYNSALIVVENSMGPGQAVCERLAHALSYDNIYYTQNATNDRAGVNMNKVVRPICMEALQTCMLNNLVKIRSTRFIRELKTFRYNKTKQRPEADKNKHDDLVIAMALALYVSDVMNREMPLLTGQGHDQMDIITKTFLNEDYVKLREELEEGLEIPDLLAEDIDIEIDLLPKIMFEIKRPNDAILKEFGW